MSKARRGELITPLPVGLAYDAAGHVILDPDTAVQGALRRLFATFEATGSASACVKAFNTDGLTFPWRHRAGPRKGELDRKPLQHHAVLRVLHNPRYADCFTFGRRRDQILPGGKTVTTLLPREEWIAFIPGAHPGYITTGQYEANLATLAANAAAHGPDRAAGPPREGTALLQGIIICGRCGTRMTLRYHTRSGRQTPTYVCQRDGISHGHPPCTVIPGHTLDERIGEFLISQLTPLAAEAALTVSAGLQHRAAEAGALRAAHVERARYHAGVARRRYLAADPASRLVAGTLEAGWNTALRALNDARAAYGKAREQHPGQLTDQQKTRIRQPVTDLPGIWDDPATPMRERKRITRLLLTDVTLTSGEGRPFHRLIIRNIRDDYQLRSREQRLCDAGMLTLAEIAAQLGVSTGTIKTWHHAGLITGHPHNDKGQCLYPPPGPNPPARAQGRKLSQRRPASPADDA